MDANAADTEVWVGIRPEGFIPDDNGKFECALDRIEVMGRDISVVASHEASINPVVRAIIGDGNVINDDAETVRFSLRSGKVYVFDKQTENRIEV